MDSLLIDLFHPEAIIAYGGVTLLLIIIFAETGLFFGFFLPGDSLLFVAGVLCDSPAISIPVWWLIVLVIVAAVMGTTIGYGFGYWAKDYLDRRKENYFYRKSYLEIAGKFYGKFGMVAFIIGRFLPIVRTFVPIVAGIVRIDFAKFLFYNFLGAVCWAVPLIMLGYWLGNIFPGVVDHLEIIILGMILLSAVPIAFSWWKNRKMFTDRI